MNKWDEDREEILRHWNRLGFFWRIVILFFFRRTKKTESIVYLLDRLHVRPDCMVKTGEESWDTIRNFLKATP